MKVKAIIFDLNGCLGGPGALFAVTKFGLLIEEFKKHNIKLFILSNGTGSHLRSHPEHAQLVRKYFTGEYYSNMTGHMKPDEDAWSEIMVAWDLKPSECLFVDDSHENVTEANKIGFNAHLFTSSEECMKVLQSVDMQ